MKHRMLILLSLLLVVMLALAACGDDDGNGDNETNGSTGDAATPTPESDAETGGTGPVDFTISGDPDVDRTVTGAFAATDVTNEEVSLLFFVNMSDLVVNIVNIPYDQAPGTYAIKTSLDLNDVSAEAVNAAANFTTYSSTEGTLEITEWNDDTMSGTFEFTAEREVDEGETSTTITVSGTFDGITAPKPVE